MKRTTALAKALAVLESVAEDPGAEKGLGEIAANAGLNKATCAHILKTLVETGYAEQDAPRCGYRLGPMAYRLARGGPYRRDLALKADPFLAELARETGETAVLAALRGGTRLVLGVAEGNQGIQVRSDILHHDDVYRTATGRVLLAHLSDEELASFVATKGLPGAAWPGARTKAGLRKVLARVRRSGEALNRREPGVVQVARPVREAGEVAAAIGLALPEMRFRGAHRRKVTAALEAAAGRIGAALSGGKATWPTRTSRAG
jgi:DNA-binding IclR family transcriptional regulator